MSNEGRTDCHDPETRSYNMSRIRSTHTKPEEIVSKHLFHAGFRNYRRNARKLPGSPDFVLKKYRVVIFVNGCFWHGHGCKYFHWPKSNTEYWTAKINGNMERDQRKHQELEDQGWRVLTVWECDLKDQQQEILEWLVSAIRET